MDDFTVSGLHESKNEWAARLLTILAPHIIDGFRSILDESAQMCRENDEMDKYLMTFQNLIARIPKWNPDIVTSETQRIIEKSGCNYLEDLITCIHVIQLKILTAVRVGQKQKKVELNVMSVNDFVHKSYINSARQMYRNVYLFDIDVQPLQRQKNNREIELIVQECILNTIRDSIPVETILKCYMDETTEEDITEEVKEEDITPVPDPVPVSVPDPITTEMVDMSNAPPPTPNTSGVTTPQSQTDLANAGCFTDPANAGCSTDPITLTFNDIDNAVDVDKNEFQIEAPKNISRLQEISDARYAAAIADDDDTDKLVISTSNIKLDDMDIQTIEEPRLNILPPLLDDIEVL
jgi:hypothetical protein